MPCEKQFFVSWRAIYRCYASKTVDENDFRKQAHARCSKDIWRGCLAQYQLHQQANTVKLAQANQLFSASRLAAERSEHYSSIVQLYEQYQVQKQGLDQYRVSLTGLGTLPLLDTALKLSQITAIEYVLETTYLYAATDTLGELERDLHLTAVDLYKFQLN